jgi:hypothetical protein
MGVETHATPGSGLAPPPTPSSSPARSAWRSHALAVGGYAVLIAVFFWPVLTHLSTRVLSDGMDGASYLWNMWSIPRAILRGDQPFATQEIFYPLGARTAFNTNMPLVAVLSWPLQKAFGLGVAANLVQLVAVLLSAVGAYLLADHVCRDRRAAFVAGAAFAFLPYRFAHISGHHDLVHLEFIPFGLLTLLRLYEAPSRRRAVVFGVVFGLTVLTNLYYTAYLLIAALVVAAWNWRRTVSREMALRLGQAGLAGALVALPLLIAMVRELFFDHYLDPLPGWGSADHYSADVLSWVTPSALQRVWGTHFLARDVNITGGERLAFPGYAVLGLAAAGAFVGAWRRRALWWVLAAVFAVLALGPILHFNGKTGALFHYHDAAFTVPLPYIGLHFLPVLNGVRVPGRFSVVTILALDVLAAVALARLAAARPRLGKAVAVLALVAVVVEFYPRPMAVQPVAVPRPYAAIAADPDPGAVLEIPLQWVTGFGSFGDPDGNHTQWMYYATRHGKPLTGGMVARYPKRKVEELRRIPVYSQLMAMQTNPPIGIATFGPSELRDLGIGFVVYHRDRPRPEVERYFEGLGMSTLADDGTVRVWKVPGGPGPKPGRSEDGR